MIRIAILYICTGKYNQFFKGFYESCERFFLKGKAEKEYFVFTDDFSISSAKNVHFFKRECKGFPLDSLLRFEMFLSIKEELNSFDYVFFFNANMQFVAEVGEEFLPATQKLMAVIHPGFYNKHSMLLPYERNRESTAYIPRIGKKEYKYYMGSLNGGKTADFLELARVCANNTRVDLDNNIVAMVHDESHLNKYLSEHNCLGLSPEYAYPENWNLPFSPRIIIRDKTKFDPYFNKGRDFSLKGRMKKGFGMLWRAIIWYI